VYLCFFVAALRRVLTREDIVDESEVRGRKREKRTGKVDFFETSDARLAEFFVLETETVYYRFLQMEGKILKSVFDTYYTEEI
jgi:hypothetical protein